MSTYSTQFFRGALSANVLKDLYTVQANTVVVIRDVELLISAEGDLFNLQIGPPGSTTVVWYVSGAPASSWHQWQGRTVAPAGEHLWAYSGLGAAQLIVSGYLLSD